MKILFIGDIVGKPGRKAIVDTISDLVERENIELVVANGENVAGGSGITPDTADFLFENGIDVITSGDHIWKRKEVVERIKKDFRILRPANYPENVPGVGGYVYQTRYDNKIGVINLQGRIFMKELDCPFRSAMVEIKRIRPETNIILVDIHAEATSEKLAMGWYLDGLVSAVVGTHTHVQTADERILSKGTAYITDLGMTGPHDSVLGRRKDRIIERFLTNMPIRFPVAKEDIRLQGVIIDISERSGLANSIKRINIGVD